MVDSLITSPVLLVLILGPASPGLETRRGHREKTASYLIGCLCVPAGTAPWALPDPPALLGQTRCSVSRCPFGEWIAGLSLQAPLISVMDFSFSASQSFLEIVKGVREWLVTLGLMSPFLVHSEGDVHLLCWYLSLECGIFHFVTQCFGIGKGPCDCLDTKMRHVGSCLRTSAHCPGL